MLLNDKFIRTNEPIVPYTDHRQSTPLAMESSRAFKTGFLYRTKLLENGKRIRKNWCVSMVALTNHYLLIFKESKSDTNHEGSNLRPEIAVELWGSLIGWTHGLSSRRNVFQLTTIMGNQILLQEDCSFTAAEWFYSIKSVITKLPLYSSQALSSSLPSNCDPNQRHFDDSISSESSKEVSLKRSKSAKLRNVAFAQLQEEISKKFQVNTKAIPKNNADEKIVSEKKKKIRERLINLLRGRPSLDSLREKGIFKDEPVFGCDLQSLCSREEQLVPKFVQQCIKAIEQKGLQADGLYRVCGNLSEVQKIRFQVNHDNYDGIWAQEDVHVLTGALKLFFRDMKEPLFPCNRFNSLMLTIGLSDKKEKHDAIVKVVLDLPKSNKETLKYLLRHLLRVQDYKDKNRMHIQNLAIVFGPNLMWPETDSNNLAYDMMLKMHSNQVIELLLLHHDSIFG